MWKFVKHHELYLGTLILLFSTAWMILLFNNNKNWLTAIPMGVSWVGLICLFDFLERKYFSHTIIPDTNTKKRKLFIIITTSLLFCILLDGFGVFITNLWHYTFWSVKVYLVLAPFAYVAYSILLYILYEFARDMILRYRKFVFIGNVNEKFYKKIMDTELTLGTVGYFASIFTLTSGYTFSNSMFYIFGLIMISTFFIFEFIGFKQNKQTLTHDILSRNWGPIIFILIANVAAVILIEFANGPFQVWHFTNWPLNEIRFLNVPLIAILLWPIQFPVFLSMLRVVFRSKEVVW